VLDRGEGRETVLAILAETCHTYSMENQSNTNQMKNTNKIIIAGVSVALAATAIAGGIAFKNAKDEAAKKEAARIAYENRPIIETPACIMNGWGKGDCKFTNTGKTAGYQCGYISVQGPGVVYSEQFCSGSVQPYSTTKVEFDIPAVNELCDNGFESWTKKCEFSFVPNGTGKNSV